MIIFIYLKLVQYVKEMNKQVTPIYIRICAQRD
jgi:hypothetical protein